MANPRSRVAVIAGSVALSMSVALAPAAFAQDDPTTPVNEVLTAFSEGRIADATAPFCAELEATALGGLGQISALPGMGLGDDIDLLFGAIVVDTSALEVAIVEQSDESATVNVAGQIEVGFDEEGVITLVTAMMSTDEAPLTEEMVAAMLPMMMPELEAMIGGPVDVDEDVQVILEDAVWQVCDDMSALGDALASAMGGPVAGDAADASGDDMDDTTAEDMSGQDSGDADAAMDDESATSDDSADGDAEEDDDGA